ncbi:hypothetical protein fugu_006959 [Takifugu bimaculatus]|uniref:Centrosome-associated FAM110 C-terminal domain-containing protein n=1 Tax=Takifugu bimaculatus TaxID=433685 RepID=A0A4Z2B4I5_9TELE|nr:hypothetical protein fugu_006959 [Takifugu bimaculatus]
MRDGDGTQGQKLLMHKMPLERLRHPVRRDISATPPRLRPKGPVGLDLHHQFPAAAGRPKQSAVERLEADKAKYVKSQVALSKQLPVQLPDAQKVARGPAAAPQPTRKPAVPTKPRKDGVQLDLKHLTKLISDVGVGAQTSAAPEPQNSTPGDPGPRAQLKTERPCPPPRPDWSSPAKVRLKASAPSRVGGPGVPGAPAAGTVRRVDVMPLASPARPPCRPPLFIRKPLHPISLTSQLSLRPAASQLHLSQPRTPGPSPLKPVAVPSKPEKPPPGTPVQATPPAPLPALPPSSPARTRLSSSSSRKRPSLTRSKSDLSDRCSRAGTELERFFNLCGLDPADLQEWTGSTSDIVSMARFRSVSAPGSECEASNRDENDAEEEDGPGVPEGRVPYGVSVIERNARVIKWLYGLRSAKDGASKSTDL